METNANRRLYFYQGENMYTDLQGPESIAVFRGNGVPLAERLRVNNKISTQLLATSPQRSVLEVHTGRDIHSLLYAAYGSTTTENRVWPLLKFNGEHQDSLTGDYLLGNGHRVYNPILMRFNSPDYESPFSIGGPNSYAYCAGNPVSLTDPTGKAPVRLTDTVNLPRQEKKMINRRIARSRAESSNNYSEELQRQATNNRQAAERTEAQARNTLDFIEREILRSYASDFRRDVFTLEADARILASRSEHYRSFVSSKAKHKENNIPKKARENTIQTSTNNNNNNALPQTTMRIRQN